MSSRITRSTARPPTDPANLSNLAPSSSSTAQRPLSTRKRKAPRQRDSSPPQTSNDSTPQSGSRRSKRQKVNDNPEEPTSSLPAPRAPRRKADAVGAAMSNTGSSSKHTEDASKATLSVKPAKRPSSRSKKSQDVSPPTQTPPTRRQKKRPSRRDPEASAKEEEDKSSPGEVEKTSPPPMEPNDSDNAGSPRDIDDVERDDPFTAGFLGGGRGPPMGLSGTLRALSGMMSGMSSRLRDILNNLRQTDNPSLQLVALEDLSNLLLVSNEDNLSGQFSPDPYVKELVALMQPNPVTGEENPEMMLLACRCIANLMEALRGSVANVVYGGAVPVLCQKLLDIQYIDVAEQALSTLSKISVDFPAAIVREGGLTACLQFLDFFATGTQRTAVTTAANCCRNIPHDSFPVIRDVMPILLNVLVSHDQKVVEQGCLCVTRVIDSFKHSHDKLENLVDPPLLKAILGLLLPGTVNLVGANIHTEFLRVLAIVARASPRLSVELLKMNVVDTLYQILTGVSPPEDTPDAASKIDSVVIMQALIHRPREQVYETLNVICELLPRPKGFQIFLDDSHPDLYHEMSDSQHKPHSKGSSSDRRLQLLEDCKAQTRRFAIILLPTLTDAFSSTVNLNVRQKVLSAQLKMLSNLSVDVIEDALRPVPYASFLASILSQEDHPSLVMSALQAAELLYQRLENIYQYQFYREGVISEIRKLADRPLGADSLTYAPSGPVPPPPFVHSQPLRSSSSLADRQPTDQAADEKLERDYSEEDIDEHEGDDEADLHEGDSSENDNDENEEDEDEDEDPDPNEDEDIIVRDGQDASDSPSSDSSEDGRRPVRNIPALADMVTARSQKFLAVIDSSKGQKMREKAEKIQQDLQSLAHEIEACYLGDGNGDGKPIFARLAKYFNGDALDSITSSELLSSDIIHTLLKVFGDKSHSGPAAKADFLESFMTMDLRVKFNKGSDTNGTTPFSFLVQKLQDLLSRAEQFEVLTVNNSASDSSRGNSTSMLSKQLRLKLTADADSDIPQGYRDITVSIHAIATFKALDDYLRPRISLSERPSSASRRREMLAHLASARMRELSGMPDSGLFPPGMDPSRLPPGLLGSAKSKSPRSSSKVKTSTGDQTGSKPSPMDERSAPRRSSRRIHGSGSATLSQPPPELTTDETADKPDCSDDKRASEESNLDAAEALEAIIDHVEDEMSDEDPADPSAVNMEIASTGKVTARQEDGTRVATPLQPGTPVNTTTRLNSSNPTGAAQSLPEQALAMAGRPFSYAAALAVIPQDWHIEFSMDGKPIPKETTIYRAVYYHRDQLLDPSSRNIWSGVHSISFKRVQGPPPESNGLDTAKDRDETSSLDDMPASLDKHPTTSAILSLLSLLHEMNALLTEIQIDRSGVPTETSEPLSSFINTKLTAKMNRQLEEPLIVASNCLPGWSEDLARLFPFLFPFETRHLFLQSTSFGYSRSMMRWQNTQADNDDRRDRRRDERPLMGRLQRQKVRISRTRILESALKVMEMYGASPSVLEVEYFEEVGTGLGPTLEFYSTVSKEFSKKKLKLWRENDSNGRNEYAFGKLGLFPAPMSDEAAESEPSKKLLHFFKMLGKFVARSMLDSRIIDVSFSPTFFRLANNPATDPSLELVKTIDLDLAKSLAQVKQFAIIKSDIEKDMHLSAVQKVNSINSITVGGARIEDLMLDFTLPGYPSIELTKDGANTAVTIDNVAFYVERVLGLTLGSGVARQIAAFKAGFSQVFSYSSLRAFTPNELVMLFGRVEEDWSIETLMDSVKADHGFNMDSKSVKNLLQTMSELTPSLRRDFLQFVTGSPKLPIGGFKSLTPMFTVVCKPSEAPYTSDDYLPSVMTCVNYLKLPDYTNLEILRERLNVAIQEGQGAFHLS